MPGTLKLKSEAGGSVILAANTTAASDYTVTIPPVAGTMATLVANTTGPVFSVPNVAGNGPAFMAFLGTQSVSADTATKINFNNVVFDTNSRFNATGSTVNGIPAYSFMPNVAGYYQVNMSSYWTSYSAGSFVNIALYKNGTGYTEYSRIYASSGTMSGSGLVYLNGTSDYISAYWYAAGGTCTLVASNGSFFSNFSASLVRAA